MDPIAVGGAYNLDVSALEGFDYVALGHIHRPQAIGRPTVRYAGSPLKYSFSEARHEKSVTLVEIKEKGQVELTALPLAPKRDMLVVEGPLEALLSAGEPSDCFVRAILTDEGPVLDAAARLKTIYPDPPPSGGRRAGGRGRRGRAAQPRRTAGGFFCRRSWPDHEPGAAGDGAQGAGRRETGCGPISL